MKLLDFCCEWQIKLFFVWFWTGWSAIRMRWMTSKAETQWRWRRRRWRIAPSFWTIWTESWKKPASSWNKSTRTKTCSDGRSLQRPICPCSSIRFSRTVSCGTLLTSFTTATTFGIEVQYPRKVHETFVASYWFTVKNGKFKSVYLLKG